MKFETSLYNVGYPVYGARFLNNSTLLVAGGGGEGNNGIPNKLTALQVNFSKRKVVKRFRELTLDPNDDSPTTLDVANNVILMGCNENSKKIESGQENHHLRKYVYENDHLRFVASVDLNRTTNAEDYTKLTYISRDGSVAAVASSKVPTIIRIVQPENLKETYEIETGNDVKDLHFSPDGKVLSYITASTLEVISIVTGRFIIRKTNFDKNWTLSKIRFIGEDTILIAATLKKGSGVVLTKISLKSGTSSVLKTKLVTNKFKGVTSMDVDINGQLAALASNDNSIAIVRLKNFSVAKLFKQVHSFAVTRVSFSPDSRILASVSAANTIHVIQLPEGLPTSTSFFEKLMKLFFNFLLVVMLAAAAQLSYKYNLHHKVYEYVHREYISKNDSSSYFTLNDPLRQTTLVGDIVNINTYTRPLSTELSSIDTSVLRKVSSIKDTLIPATTFLSTDDKSTDSFSSNPVESSFSEFANITSVNVETTSTTEVPIPSANELEAEISVSILSFIKSEARTTSSGLTETGHIKSLTATQNPEPKETIESQNLEILAEPVFLNDKESFPIENLTLSITPPVIEEPVKLTWGEPKETAVAINETSFISTATSSGAVATALEEPSLPEGSIVGELETGEQLTDVVNNSTETAYNDTITESSKSLAASSAQIIQENSTTQTKIVNSSIETKEARSSSIGETLEKEPQEDTLTKELETTKSKITPTEEQITGKIPVEETTIEEVVCEKTEEVFVEGTNKETVQPDPKSETERFADIVKPTFTKEITLSITDPIKETETGTTEAARTETEVVRDADTIKNSTETIDLSTKSVSSNPSLEKSKGEKGEQLATQTVVTETQIKTVTTTPELEMTSVEDRSSLDTEETNVTSTTTVTEVTSQFSETETSSVHKSTETTKHPKQVTSFVGEFHDSSSGFVSTNEPDEISVTSVYETNASSETSSMNSTSEAFHSTGNKASVTITEVVTVEDVAKPVSTTETPIELHDEL